MFKINLSRDSDYHTQLNNKIYPLEACGPTSAANCLEIIGMAKQFPGDMQLEDRIMGKLQSPEAFNLMAEIAPWAINRYKPNEVHLMLQWAVNILIGKQVDKFIEYGCLEHAAFNLAAGRPIIMSGSFTRGGHMVAIIGFMSLQQEEDFRDETKIDLSKILEFFVDDSYGNYFTKYQDHRGNNIGFPVGLLNELTNVSWKNGNKHMHIFNGEGWT